MRHDFGVVVLHGAVERKCEGPPETRLGGRVRELGMGLRGPLGKKLSDREQISVADSNCEGTGDGLSCCVAVDELC